jgi:hypothetical protein
LTYLLKYANVYLLRQNKKQKDKARNILSKKGDHHMSETAPRSNPRLDDFEANKASHEREQFESELYGEAGQTDFSDEARKRVEEADKYERHMEGLANETRSDHDRGLDRLESGEVESAAYNREHDDAIIANDEIDAYKMKDEIDAKAKADAIDAKIAADPKLRRMDYLAQQIAELRNKPVDENADADILRLKGLEDNLESYLVKYAESDDYDAELADLMIERSATAPAAKEAEKADEKKARSPEEFSETDSPEQMIADIADLISKETDPVKKAEAQEKLREIMTQIEGALEGKDKKDDLGDLDDLSAPELKDGEKSDLDDLDAAEAPKVGDEADLEDLDDKEAPKVADPADKKDVDGEEHDLEDLDKLSAPEVGEAPAETEDTRRWYKRAWDRAGLIFVLGMNKAGERMHLPEKRSTRVATAIGAVTLLAVGGALAWKYGFHHGGSGNGGNADPSTVPTPKPKVTPEVPVVPTPKGPELPSADNYAHPWNWMKAAMDNGSVTPPKGMGPEQALHYFGEKAADAGHKVEWYNLPNGLEAVRIDGSDDTKVVGDILGQFAK